MGTARGRLRPTLSYAPWLARGAAHPHCALACAPPGLDPRLELALGAACIGLILGVAFVLPLPVWSGGAPSRPPAPGASPVAGAGWPGALVALGFAVAWCVPFRPYALAVRAAAHAVPVRLLVGLSAALAVVALLIFPAYGSDLFGYVAYERLWTVYGDNPLLASAAAHPDDWASGFVWLPADRIPYGPLWPVLTWPIARLADTSLGAQIAGYKLLALIGYGVCCALIWFGVDASRRSRALVLFAWSPLVLVETLGKAHNDVLLAVAALLAVRTTSRLSLVAATTGALIKLSGAAFVPTALLSTISSKSRARVLLGILSSAVLVAAAYAPFWHGPDTLLPVLAQTSRVVWSPGSLLIAPGLDAVTVRVVLAVTWLIVVGLILRRVPEAAASACLVLLATLLLLTTAFFAHYLVPAIALAAVSDSRRLHHLVLALSIGSMAAYAVEVLSAAFGSAWIGSPAFQIAGSLVLLAPACVVLARASTGRSRG